MVSIPITSSFGIVGKCLWITSLKLVTKCSKLRVDSMLTLNLIKKQLTSKWHGTIKPLGFCISFGNECPRVTGFRFRVQDQISIYLGILEHFVHPYVDKLSSFRSTWDLSTTPKLLVTRVLTVVLLGLPDQLTGLTSTPQRICVVLSRRMRHQTNHKY